MVIMPFTNPRPLCKDERPTFRPDFRRRRGGFRQQRQPSRKSANVKLRTNWTALLQCGSYRVDVSRWQGRRAHIRCATRVPNAWLDGFTVSDLEPETALLPRALRSGSGVHCLLVNRQGHVPE